MPPSLTIAAGGRTLVLGVSPGGGLSVWPPGKFPRARFLSFFFSFILRKLKKYNEKKKVGIIVFWGVAFFFRGPEKLQGPMVQRLTWGLDYSGS